MGEVHESGATISAGGMVGTLSIRLRSHLWLWWAEIAVEREGVAVEARAAQSPDDPRSAEHLARETRESLVCVSACAHALDAVYGDLGDFDLVPASTLDSWKKNGTARCDRIRETIKHGFKIGARDAQWAVEFDCLFDLRDAAVHHHGELHKPLPHPTGTNVSLENVHYSLESSRRGVDLLLDVLDTATSSPREPTRQWARDFRSAFTRLSDARSVT